MPVPDLNFLSMKEIGCGFKISKKRKRTTNKIAVKYEPSSHCAREKSYKPNIAINVKESQAPATSSITMAL